MTPLAEALLYIVQQAKGEINMVATLYTVHATVGVVLGILIGAAMIMEAL